MSLDIYIDVTIILLSQGRLLDLKGLELNAEIETGTQPLGSSIIREYSGSNSARMESLRRVISDLMAAAGSTHGGFYRHFDPRINLSR